MGMLCIVLLYGVLLENEVNEGILDSIWLIKEI
jgi:hypothetical protein